MTERRHKAPGRLRGAIRSGSSPHTRLSQSVRCDDIGCVRVTQIKIDRDFSPIGFCCDPVVKAGTTTLVCGGGRRE